MLIIDLGHGNPNRPKKIFPRYRGLEANFLFKVIFQVHDQLK